MPDREREHKVSQRLLDAAAIAERLGVPKTWVLESARSGAMPCVRLGRYVRFDLDDVERWLEECKCPGRPIALRARSASSRRQPSTRTFYRSERIGADLT
jgi:excisionase family DNA binding protein